ncbi:DUF2489 domain-containing protein [Alcanivorax sp.]|uniref:DUF2489 domain-containing protein n=1 Tax=Alcanivorax sp. TaxID=1872427 RepID=UPI000C4AA569|nr:DUF2489 domain-containing protein [Alcanivorax sp.]MBU85467.1 hypothetical protein [Alcanivorax sp.]
MSQAGQIMLAAVIGLLIGAALGLMIWRYWLAHREKQAARAQQVQILDSLDVLCRAVEQKQVELSEASIRISALLDCLPDSVEPKVDLASIHQFAETCQQFDRGEQRQGLTARARLEQDSHRWQLEEEQSEVLNQATRRLAKVLPTWRNGLGI